MLKSKSILLLLILAAIYSCSNDSKNSNITVNLRTPSSNCLNATTNEECNNKPLKNASVILRKLNSTNIVELQADTNGSLLLSAKPGNYEIGLSRRYAYTNFMEIFGETACKFNDDLNNGNGACEERGNSCLAVRASSSYPANYSPNNDPGYERFLEITEAIGILTIEKTNSTVNLEYGLRCI